MPHETQQSLVGRAVSDQSTSAPQPHKQRFNAVQLRLFRYTAVLLCIVAMTALITVILWTFAWVLNAFYNLLLSLAIAGVLALVLHPVADFLETRLRLPRVLAVSILLVTFLVGIGSLITLLVPVVVSQAIELMTVVPELLIGWQSYLDFYYPEISALISNALEGGDRKEPSAGIKGTGTTIMSYLGVLAAIAFMPLFLFFTLLSGERLRKQVAELLSIFHRRTQGKALYFMDVFVEYVTAFFQGQLIIALVMGTMYATGFTFIGLEFGVLIGLVLGVLNIVPFLGSLIGLVVVLPMAYLQPGGDIELLALAGLVFAAVQLIESWLLTPKIMADRSGLHPALVIISLFFWGTVLNGVIGMILAVPLTAFFVAIWGEIKASLKHTLNDQDSRA